MSQLVAVREFSTVSEMMAHYKAVRSRTWRKAAPAVKADEPVAPVKPVKPVRKQRHWSRIETRTDRVRRIMAVVAAHYDIEQHHLWGPSQVAHIAHIRRIAMYLTRELTGLSLKQIGNRFNRDHTTVLCGIRRVAAEIQTDAELRQVVEHLAAQLREVTDGR